MSEFSSNVVTYVAGYVSRKLCTKLKCVGCKSCLLSTDHVVTNSKLLTRKNNGGLVVPSESTVTVCCVTERCIRLICSASPEKIPRQRNMNFALQVAVIDRTEKKNLFSAEHSCFINVIDGFQSNLVRLIVNEYVNIRFYSMGKTLTDKLRGKNVRFNSNKNVIFAHQ